MLMSIEGKITSLTADEIEELRRLVWDLDRDLHDETLRGCVKILSCSHCQRNAFTDTLKKVIEIFLENPLRQKMRRSDVTLAKFADGVNSYFDLLVTRKAL